MVDFKRELIRLLFKAEYKSIEYEILLDAINKLIDHEKKQKGYDD